MDFDSLKDKAEDLVKEHGDKIEDGIDKAGELAEKKFGHEEQIEAGVDKLKGLIPGGE
jgi:hypothetical protein